MWAIMLQKWSDFIIIHNWSILQYVKKEHAMLLHNSIMSESILYNNRINIIMLKVKNGILRPDTLEIAVTHSNVYINQNNTWME